MKLFLVLMMMSLCFFDVSASLHKPQFKKYQKEIPNELRYALMLQNLGITEKSYFRDTKKLIEDNLKNKIIVQQAIQKKICLEELKGKVGSKICVQELQTKYKGSVLSYIHNDSILKPDIFAVGAAGYPVSLLNTKKNKELTKYEDIIVNSQDINFEEFIDLQSKITIDLNQLIFNLSLRDLKSILLDSRYFLGKKDARMDFIKNNCYLGVYTKIIDEEKRKEMPFDSDKLNLIYFLLETGENGKNLDQKITGYQGRSQSLLLSVIDEMSPTNNIEKVKIAYQTACALIDAGANPNKDDNDLYDQTPLGKACGLSNSSDLVKKLLEAGANPNQLPGHPVYNPYDCRYPLHTACFVNDNQPSSYGTVMTLIKHHADPQVKTSHGFNPLDYVLINTKNGFNLLTAHLLMKQGATMSESDVYLQGNHLPESIENMQNKYKQVKNKLNLIKEFNEKNLK